MTSAAEARLAANVGPAIAVVRSRSSYPVRRRPAAPARGHADGGQVLAAVAADAAWRARQCPAGQTAPGRLARGSSPATASRGAGLAAARLAASPDTLPAGGPAAVRPATSAAGITSPANRPPAVRSGIGSVRVRPGAIRLTRRGRMVVAAIGFMAAVAVAAVLWLALAGQARASSQLSPSRGGTSGMARVVVQPGQTLWGIALGAEPTADPRAVIQQIIDVNSLTTDQIHPGEILWVPRA